MNKFGTTMGFGNVLVSSFLLDFGLSIVISSKLSYGLAVIFILLSIMSFLLFISDKNFRFVVKNDVLYKKKFTFFYFTSVLVSFLVSLLFPSYYYLSVLYIYPCSIYMAKKMLISYEYLTGGKVE
ncbi:hypothetical protein KW538_08085 [Vibrio fluvialis]|nr:hypothetical protein [Vibrio fluvialis]